MDTLSAPSHDSRQTLLELLARLSFRLGTFTLASGQKSDFYIDCRTTTLDAEGGRLAGVLLLDLMREHFGQAVAVGGLTLGADPLVANIASASAWERVDWREFTLLAPEEDHGGEPPLVHGFIVRKAEKAHGTGRRIEGFVAPGAIVVIVDDVCTTGSSTVEAIEAARAAGMRVAGALALVDREGGGRTAVEAALGPGAAFLSLYTASEVRRAHEASSST